MYKLVKQVEGDDNSDWIVVDKQGNIILQCNDETLYAIECVYGSIENYLKTQQTELEF